MRLVQVLIPKGKREPVLAVLDDEQIDYAVWDETGRREFEALVQFPIPPIGVEPVMARLREAGISENAYTIVLSPETVVSSRLKALKKRYSGLRISREELITLAEDLALGSGLTGTISIMRGFGSTLVGVAIALALVPHLQHRGSGLPGDSTTWRQKLPCWCS